MIETAIRLLVQLVRVFIYLDNREEQQQQLEHCSGKRMAGDEVDGHLWRQSSCEVTSSSQAESVVS